MTDPTLPDTTLPDSTDSATPRPGVTDPDPQDRAAPPAGERARDEGEQEEAAAIEAIRTDPALRREAESTQEQNAPEEDDRMRVQWVRPTDLAARAGARVLEKGVELNQHSVDLARQAALEAARGARDRLRQALARREQALTPDTPTTAGSPVAGRQGVSR
ncbi:hypothetical protein FM104_11450 [Microbacterium esteraromaticum]|uniref:Uncharacterized protein n=1 Tax=Microbacterium esteraromaticum TaxID=57043 RepID=A0A1R4KBY0_9MICO|nr:hypothetical protein [Microbacterium esteraromaticum]SJN41513.1 hypothetical protein FM104_11450 [Microbacterium esteraromaticum]